MKEASHLGVELLLYPSQSWLKRPMDCSYALIQEGDFRCYNPFVILGLPRLVQIKLTQRRFKAGLISDLLFSSFTIFLVAEIQGNQCK